jgi:uncharacterized lipoprotein YddW (UPF0748 family)
MIRLLPFIFCLYLISTISASENEEFRSVWVITWEHINSGNTAEENKTRVRQILDNVAKANMNAVLWQARQSGTAYYNSSYEPWGRYAGYSDPGYDPLAYAIEEAHKRGLELHAWFNVFAVAEDDPALDPLPPAVEHPNWVCRNGSGHPMPRHMAFSPGLDSVRTYTIDVAMEIVNKYDIDGLHLDYVRWNEYDTESVLTASEFYQDRIDILDERVPKKSPDNKILYDVDRYLWDVDHPHSEDIPDGFDTWEDWWRWSVTEFVKTLHDSIRAVKPWVRLSPAALGRYNWGVWNGYYSVYQDAAHWFNQGYIDQLTPMHYHWLTPDGFYEMLEGGCPDCWGESIQEGINAGRLFSVGPASYRFAEQGVWDNHPAVIERCRDVAWTDGFQFFSYGAWNSYQYWDEARELFFTQKTKIRAAKYMIDSTPDVPSIILSKTSSLVYEITLDPPLSIDKNQWFAIYRSEDDTLSVDNDEIIDIHFGQETYAFSDSSSGLQDFNGQFTYYATMLDRVWNESDISNSSISDSIPSFAPQVFETIPAEYDTVDVNSSFLISFSKRMDINSFQDHVLINPSVEILPLIWSEGEKELTISFQENLEYATDYTLTIERFVTDINGKQLDGNGDGIAGDDFVLNFVTKEYDNTGPKVIFSHPNQYDITDDFDVDDILSLAFDEIIDENTVDENSVYVTFGLNTVNTNSIIFNSENNHSIISIQPEIPFDPVKNYTVYYENTITDTLGNPMDSTIQIEFQTEPYIYQETIILDNFTMSGYWWNPGGSGSTNGVNDAESYFESSNSEVYLPASSTPFQKRSGKLYYVWDAAFLDPPESDYLLREFLDYGAPPKSIQFDTTYTLQCYVFGDGSGNKFRFSLSEVNGSGYPLEVSKWVDIDWYGWKLIEWDLSDPNSVGSWLGNEILDGSSYNMDSFQLTHEEGNAISGTLYFKDLRVIKKEYNTVGAVDEDRTLPTAYHLSQNYPNPFNAQTKINFSLAKSGLTHLIVYDLLGRKIITLVDEHLNRGKYSISFDASNLASGLYIYELRSNNISLRQKMMLVK